MIFKKLFIFIFFFLAGEKLCAQNISGFQIFVSKEQLTSLEFHSDIDNLAFTQKNPPYKVTFMGTKMIFLETSQDIKEPYNLSIIEGGRTHKFVVYYEPDVDQSKRDNDYSDLNQLKTLIKNFVPVTITTEKADKGNSNNDFQNSPKNSPDNAANSTTNTNFYVLIDEADRSKKSGQLEAAKTKYQQALQIQPDNSYAQAQLQAVNDAMESAMTSKYDSAIFKATIAAKNMNYDDAVTYYKAAIEVMPGDAFASNQLADVQKKMEAAKAEQAIIQKENLFNSYVKTADKALADKDYASAQIAYNEALKLKPNNTAVVTKINSIGKQKIKDSIDEVNQRNEGLYNSFVNAGEKALTEKSYDVAKLSFGEALKLKPANNQLKVKINSINQIVYTNFLTAGNDAFNKKSYDEAKDAYNEALKLKPGDATALAKIKLTESQEQKDEQDNNFNNYVVTGDKALNEKSYQLATVAYTEALKIKPADVSTKTKLSSISKLIASDSLESQRKHNEDLYAGFIATGNKALNEKSFDEARISFSQALKIKPGDVVANEKIKLIDQALYESFLNEGDEALSAKQYGKAADAYRDALKIKPGDNTANSKLAQIEKDKEQDKVNDTYNSYMAAGNEAINNKDFAKAKISFSRALTIKHDDSLATAKIKFIVQKIKADSLAVTQLKTENNFKDLMSNAKLAADKKDYVQAEFYYTESLKLKPGDELATAALSSIKQSIDKVKTDSINKLNNEKQPVVVAQVNNASGKINGGDLSKSSVHEIETSMLLVKARLFKMGSNVGATDESPKHTVRFDSFYISKFEVTQSQWQNVMGSNPSFFKDCDDCPVENVSWNDAMKFIEKLNQITGKHFRLPTEAEWEYVAGTQSKKDNIDNIAWYGDNSKNKTHHIGLLKPDYLGVYDMFGNVAEWCNDWYSSSSYKNNLSVNPQGPSNGKTKVIRGGNWYNLEGAFRISIRDNLSSDKSNKKTGFRLAMDSN